MGRRVSPGKRQYAGIVSVVVADDQMLAAVEAPPERIQPFALAIGEVAEMPDHVVMPDSIVPGGNQRLVHGRDIREGPLRQADDVRMTEMRVGGEEYGHTGLRFQALANLTS